MPLPARLITEMQSKQFRHLYTQRMHCRWFRCIFRIFKFHQYFESISKDFNKTKSALSIANNYFAENRVFIFVFYPHIFTVGWKHGIGGVYY